MQVLQLFFPCSIQRPIPCRPSEHDQLVDPVLLQFIGKQKRHSSFPLAQAEDVIVRWVVLQVEVGVDQCPIIIIVSEQFVDRCFVIESVYFD